MEFNFSEIRPYRTQEEIRSAVKSLIKDNIFYNFANQMFEKESLDIMIEQLTYIHSIEDFQKNIIYKLLIKLVKETTDGVTVEGLEQLDKNKNYLFISNHRDIIMDSALLCYLLLNANMDTVEIAIGSNLLIHPWIEQLIKLNKSFIVKRGISGKEQLLNAKELSAYILNTITNRRQSVWLAQKEGRTKNGIDKTQLSVLKMLNYSGGKSAKENLEALNIVPLSISYEYEPCDFLKTKELVLATNGEYTKTTEDDMLSMFMGLKMQKGKIHFSIGTPLELPQPKDNTTNNDMLAQAVTQIDTHIVSNYKLFPNNYIALDILQNSQKHTEHYSIEQKENFVEQMEKKLSKIDNHTLEHKRVFLEIYANPILEQQKL